MHAVTRLAAAFLVLGFSSLNTRSESSERTLSRASLEDKIRGGWAGQMIGVAYGAPTEFRSNGKIGEWSLAWKAGMLENTIEQDDLYVEMTFAKVMDDHGIDAPIRAYGDAFRRSQYPLWHANAAARRLLNLGIRPPWTGHPKFNAHAHDIDFQIEADFIGLMCPGLPRFSNRLCNRVGRVMNYGDGLYGGMFVCGMYAAAFFESDLRKVVESGLACIPAESGYARLIRDVLDTSGRFPADWHAVWHTIENKWNRDDPCPEGALSPFNIDARLNGAYIVLGLLYGGGDFEKTLEIATRCGQDSDCNPSSAGGILGVILGYQRIPPSFTTEFPSLAGRKFAYTEFSFDDIVRSTELRALEAIRRSGGTVTEHSLRLPIQAPKAPRPEVWNPGKPIARIPTSSDAWSWKGTWTSQAETRTASTSDCMATLTFEGTGIALLGRTDARQGQATVQVDGRRSTVVDAYNVERTQDPVVWHTLGLKRGRHTLRIAPTGGRNPQSLGNEVSLQGAIVYDAAEVR